MRVLAGLLLLLGATSCSTIHFVRDPQSRTYTEPVYSSSKEFFLWGLTGPTHDIYADRICLGKDIDQIATTYTPKDFFFNLITLGIYSPRSVQIWCAL